MEKKEGFKVAITVHSEGECVYQCFSLQAVVDCVISVFYHRYAGSLVGLNSSIIGIYILSTVFFPFLFFCLYWWSSRKPSPAIRGSLYLQLSIWIVVVNLDKGNSGSLCMRLWLPRGNPMSHGKFSPLVSSQESAWDVSVQELTKLEPRMTGYLPWYKGIWKFSKMSQLYYNKSHHHFGVALLRYWVISNFLKRIFLFYLN